jgi:D-alanyl-lipoteichoic acid acyltransferase DltB (MBOAT superfamily)
MTLLFILVFSACGLGIGWLRPGRAFTGVVLVLSLLSIFWLQPLSPIRNLDFWLPMASIALTVFVWAVTFPGETRSLQQALPGLAIITLVVIGIALTRYLDLLCCLTPLPPPQLLSVLMALALILGIWAAAYYLLPGKPSIAILAVVVLVGLFIVIKSEALSEKASAWLRSLTGQSTELAASSDLAWLGFSFLAFRLLHAARDRQALRLPQYSLSEFAAYALYFPAVISGPIDRSQHFIGEVNKARDLQRQPGWQQRATKNTIAGLQRILIGTFKKVVLADSLALFALNSQNAAQTSSTLWMWVLLLAYSLRIYLDFSGYTDIALGVSICMGISLPENFDRPYTKRNLTAFWNSWHMTLAGWFRSYVFNPFTRFLRSRNKDLQTWVVILCGQLLTMSLIGLWHGITWNFLIWGLWHGIGLFIQNRWSDWLGPRLDERGFSSGASLALQTGGWLATFTYVCLGWVWFALPSPAAALSVFSLLFGGEAR